MDKIDIVAEMATDPGTRPICGALTTAQRKSLLTRKGQTAGLKARRLVCPGPGFHLTPMGAQWRQDLIENDRMRRAITKAMEMLRDGSEHADVLEVLAGGLG